MDAQAWSFHLVVLFLNALPVELKKILISQGYKLPRMSTLNTVERQHYELEVLKEATVANRHIFEEERQRIEIMITSFSRHRHPHCRNSNFFT